MTTQAYKVELDFDPADVNFRSDVIRSAQTLDGFLHVGVSVRRQKVTVLFTSEQDALLFRLKWQR